MLITAIISVVFIVVPIGCAWYLWRLDEPTKVDWVIAFLITAAVLILIILVGRWDIAGLRTRYSIGCLVLAASLLSLRRHIGRPWLIGDWKEIWHRHSTSLISLALLCGASIHVLTGTRRPPAAQAMNFPLTGGRFVVGQGGNIALLNYHHGHRAQRYASDITAVNAAGFRATTILPRDLSDYVIFGASVIRVRTHYSHQMTAAARLMAPMKFLMLRSKRVAMRRQSLKRQNMRSMTLRCL